MQTDWWQNLALVQNALVTKFKFNLMNANKRFFAFCFSVCFTIHTSVFVDNCLVLFYICSLGLSLKYLNKIHSHIFPMSFCVIVPETYVFLLT